MSNTLPSRRQLAYQRDAAVLALLDRPRTNAELREALELSAPAIRLSLGRLRSQGLVYVDRVGGHLVWARVVT